jgi:amino acid transporter
VASKTTVGGRRTRAGLLKRFLLGRRLASEEAGHQLLPKKLALPVFASDALSSVAYATEEIMHVLILVGTAATFGDALGLSIPIAFAVSLLMLIVILSYRQTVRAYPDGGGAYTVSHENLGELPGLIAGGALLVDYILTVAVSIAAGAFALSSLAPSLDPYRVQIAIGFIVLVTLANLRGARESGALFAGPTYGFILMVLTMLSFGAYQCLTDTCPQVEASHHLPDHLQTMSLFLLLRAFSSGATALTGVEAIANGVQAFRGRRPKDQAHNAATTLGLLGIIAITMFLGITILANKVGAQPGETSVLSQVAHAVFDGGAGFVLVQIFTVLILVLAANTAYQDFPRLASILARDRFLPRQFVNRGDRLVFSNGIVLLAIVAILLIVLYDAEVTRLIQLYVLGVFTSFTLSQTGMVVKWVREKPARWLRYAVLNGIGGTTTAVVFVVVALTKFTHGAWIVMVAVPLLVLAFKVVNRHYLSVSRQLRIPEERSTAGVRTRAIIAVGHFDQGVIHAVSYAKAMRPDEVRAVHVDADANAPDLVAVWNAANLRIPLDVVAGNPARPLDGLRQAVRNLRLAEGEVATVILGETFKGYGLRELLRHRRDLRLKAQLLFEPGLVLTDVSVTGERAVSPDLVVDVPARIITVVLVSAVHNATLRAVDYASSLSPTEVRAVVFNVDPTTTSRVLEAWISQVDDVPLEAIDSPYRSVTKPLISYVREIRRREPDAIVNVVLPEFVVKKLWHQLLHNQTGLAIKRALLFEERVVVTSVPFHLS